MKLYFMGIGGTAMGNAALLAREAGHEVMGTDTGVYPPMSTVLSEAGISFFDGYDPVRLEKLAPDLVVVGNAMSRGNSEVEWLLDTRKLPYTSLPAMLHTLVLSKRRNIVVCGTHGKTTTTSIAAFLLRENGRDPGFLIGGAPQDPPMGSHLGAMGDPFVIEGDEFDTAFFDKRSKFIHYAPQIAVLNNLEFDHADIFRDLADVKRTFSHLTRIVPSKGWIVMNGDDENLASLGSLSWTRVMRVGVGAANDVRIRDFSETSAGARFSLDWKGSPWACVQWTQPGLFNVRNAAMAAVAVGLALGGDSPTGVKLEALCRFRGVRRRQEERAKAGGLTVIEDFGHHPTALAETLRSFRARYPVARLAAVFEPRTNTSRTKVMEKEFLAALGQADEIYLGPVSRPELLKSEDRFDTAEVCKTLIAHGRKAQAFDGSAPLIEKLMADTLPPDGKPRIVIFFSNGSFGGIIGRYAAAVSALTGPSSQP